jgi:hypothetical protein
VWPASVPPSALRRWLTPDGGCALYKRYRGVLAAIKHVPFALNIGIEVHEDPRPGRKRPGAKLEVKGSLEALLTLTGKVESVGSPGGICTLLTFQLPPRVITLHRRHGTSNASDEQRHAVSGAPRRILA